MTDRGLEKPEDDVAEQDRTVTGDAENTTRPERELPMDVNEADADEQSRVIEMDEDEYR
ncbi:MAG TPA: hypothetical protein VKS82_23495 [Streptosporangiaceae bacterium]|jgi:hypothetical protein|nr:hypothetical protein [Streptosporangiaceae bacterium]